MQAKSFSDDFVRKSLRTFLTGENQISGCILVLSDDAQSLSKLFLI